MSLFLLFKFVGGKEREREKEREIKENPQHLSEVAHNYKKTMYWQRAGVGEVELKSPSEEGKKNCIKFIEYE